jgi:regulator of RNase E activity RraA
MTKSTAEFCDLVALNPMHDSSVQVFAHEFPIFTHKNTRFSGRLVVVQATSNKKRMREEIAAAAKNPVVILIENYADTNCSCFDFDDLPKSPNRALGYVINGAIRNSEKFSNYPICVRARSSDPRPFRPMPPSLTAQEKKDRDLTRIYADAFTYVIGDLDGLLIFSEPEVVMLADEAYRDEILRAD